MLVPGSSGSPARSSLPLQERGRGCGIAMGFLIAAVLLTAFAAPFSPSWHLPAPGLTWAMRLVAFPITGGLGVCVLLASAGELLHALSPSRLEVDGPHLRVRVWNTWSSLWRAFRRTDARIPRDEVRWVGLGPGQTERAEIFVVHASGHAFWTGWSGAREEGERLAAQVSAWLAAQGRP